MKPTIASLQKEITELKIERAKLVAKLDHQESQQDPGDFPRYWREVASFFQPAANYSVATHPNFIGALEKQSRAVFDDIWSCKSTDLQEKEEQLQEMERKISNASDMLVELRGALEREPDRKETVPDLQAVIDALV